MDVFGRNEQVCNSVKTKDSVTFENGSGSAGYVEVQFKGAVGEKVEFGFLEPGTQSRKSVKQVVCRVGSNFGGRVRCSGNSCSC